MRNRIDRREQNPGKQIEVEGRGHYLLLRTYYTIRVARLLDLTVSGAREHGPELRGVLLSVMIRSGESVADSSVHH